jgi:hypothetical protein
MTFLSVKFRRRAKRHCAKPHVIGCKKKSYFFLFQRANRSIFFSRRSAKIHKILQIYKYLCQKEKVFGAASEWTITARRLGEVAVVPLWLRCPA